eukprot:7304842-Pyramimonas_sp.AAC.1
MLPTTAAEDRAHAEELLPRTGRPDSALSGPQPHPGAPAPGPPADRPADGTQQEDDPDDASADGGPLD